MKFKKAKFLFASALLITSFSLTACGQKEEAKEESSTKQEQTKPAEVQTMKGEELAKIEADKKDKENYLVVDVRSQEEYNEGHLPFAINMPIDTFESDYKNIESFKDKNVVLYCNSGKKSGQAADILVKNGFTKVFNADGVKKFKYDLVKYRSVLGADFTKEIKEGKAQAIIDAREEKDFKQATFDKAINIMPDDFDAKKSQLPEDKNAAIYVFCYSGNKSATLAKKLTEAGYTNVTNSLDGSKETDLGFDCCS